MVFNCASSITNIAKERVTETLLIAYKKSEIAESLLNYSVDVGFDLYITFITFIYSIDVSLINLLTELWCVAKDEFTEFKRLMGILICNGHFNHNTVCLGPKNVVPPKQLNYINI